MARIGVDYETAKQVFTRLLIQGEALSIQRARAAHGSGSNSTWQQHLARFRQEQKGKSTRQLPKDFPEHLVPLLESLWQKSLEAAEGSHAEDKEKMAAEKKQWQHQLKELKDNCQSLETQLQQAQEKANADQLIQQELQSALSEKSLEITELNAELHTERKTKTEHLADLNQSLNKAESQLAQMNQAHQDTLREMENKFVQEKERNQIAEAKWMQLFDDSKGEVKALKQQLDKMQPQLTQLGELKIERARLETELDNSLQRIYIQEQAYKTLIQAHQKLNQRLDDEKSKVMLLSRDVIYYQTKSESSQQEKSTLLKKLQQLEKEHIELKVKWEQQQREKPD